MGIRATLCLLPIALNSAPIRGILPSCGGRVVSNVQRFVIRSVHSTHHFLGGISQRVSVSTLAFCPLGGRASPRSVSNCLGPLINNTSVKIVSRTNYPTITSPKTSIITVTRHGGLGIIPLIKPSSVVLSMVTSNFGKRDFTFRNCLPVRPSRHTGGLGALRRQTCSRDRARLFVRAPCHGRGVVRSVLRGYHPRAGLYVTTGVAYRKRCVRAHAIGS